MGTAEEGVVGWVEAASEGASEGKGVDGCVVLCSAWTSPWTSVWASVGAFVWTSGVTSSVTVSSCCVSGSTVASIIGSIVGYTTGAAASKDRGIRRLWRRARGGKASFSTDNHGTLSEISFLFKIRRLCPNVDLPVGGKVPEEDRLRGSELSVVLGKLGEIHDLFLC